MYLPSFLLSLAFSAQNVFASPLSTTTTKRSDTNSTKTDPTVHLTNGSYYGRHVDSFNQDFFLGIPFAEPPIGEGRFANPVTFNGSWEGSLPATEYAFHCIGYGPDQIGYQQSEDCLYLNVVRPSGYENQTLPVAVWIHGGGFTEGGAPDRRYNLSFIVANSLAIGKPIMAASIAYRLGPFGFLNGDAIASAGAINVGLKDQRLALHWINENIAAFGGDPEKVTIWGESAGAASVGFHLTAFNGRDDGLFRAAIMESGGPVFFGELKKPGEYQPSYDTLVEKAGCANTTDSLACLRAIPFTVLNNVLNTTESAAAGWWPAFDGDFVARYGSEQLKDGAFVHVPIIVGANSDEGTAFSPRGIDTEADLVGVISATYPDAIVSKLVDAYVKTNTSDYLIPSSQTLGGDLTFPLPYGRFWRRSTSFSGDLAFIAGRRLTSQTWAAANIPTYSYRFNAIPNGMPFPISVTHFQEVAFVFNNLNGEGYAINPFGGTRQEGGYKGLSELMSKSWASFVADLDPNEWVGRDGRVVSWPSYEEGQMNMVFDANVTSYAEVDNFREAGMKIINENWGVIKR
ncbi:Alpha/Beta hydrolase protein [Rhexocercosporidium sp. MPI-PUGE-AT-0058]|nr:Alpha/Beta hydrolase protein [Rhexocercosporidium sp. MPI-PUGE-AT-0058]